MTKLLPRYRSLSSWLKETFGAQARKINLDAGLGCPNRDGTVGTEGCIYCNPRGSGTGAFVRGISLREQVDQGIAFLSRRYKCRKFLAYFQSYTSTYASPDRLAEIYAEALERPDVVGLAVGTRPDCVPDAVLDVLADMARNKLVWVEYGLQSIHDRTLQRINRGHNSGVFFDAVRRTRQKGILVVAHLILGLPGESVDDMVETARAVTDAGVWGVKLHPLYVVRGTALDRMYRAGEYVPLTQEAATEATLAVMEELSPEMVIHRMTSDPHKEELAAPLWMLDREQVRKQLEETMIRTGFRQGSQQEVRQRRQA